ncbi:5'-nucleotidase C-terminal domain-containing protein [Halorussus salilacus]|uniref:bifunctional metallophosphatase/5'-nucleotidase n=1 Tax=Halorussus salilacus TaxID=2953750 RepID=UPI00209D7F21|nr:5'-nucleotidase C-terminal domain-containing protein [Halorussus salilacus]USZ68607.1 5'-nucleotidase C-terminal domain-containing protein [Halorussus salilacus]
MNCRFVHYSDVENAYDDPERIGRLAGLIRQLRDDATFVCGTGDTTAPGLLATETGGSHVHPFFEEIAPDFATFGNHDFDNGRDALREVVAAAPQTWLSANVRTDAGDPFAADAGVRTTALASVGGTRVGFVGVTDPETLGVHPCAADLTVADPVPATERAAADLRDSGADLVVVLSHAGDRDDDLAGLDGVDLVLGGHVHDVRADSVDGTPVVHPGQRGELVSAVTVTRRGVDATLHDVTEAPVAEDVAEIYRETYVDLGLDETVATTEATLPRDRAACYPESAIGNTVADALRWAGDADLGVFHALQLRTGPPLSGEVTVGDLRSAVPFDNEIHATRLTGGEVAELLGNLATPGPDREVFGHVSGATLDWRRSETDLALASATVGGETPDESAEYTVAAPAYAFEHGLFAPLGPDRIEGTHGWSQSVLVEYVRHHGLSAGPEGRMNAVADAGRESSGSLRSL